MATWLHFVGGYYSPTTLIKEAQSSGVSRRVAPSTAGQMGFGDTVYLADWKSRAVFAKMVIERVFLESGIAEGLCAGLMQVGQAEYVPSSSAQVVRKCGTYTMVGSWVASASLQEIVRLAIQLAEGEGTKPWFMVGGPLTETYDVPLPVSTSFFRGFKRLAETAADVGGGILSAVAGYKQRVRKRRRDIQMELEMDNA